jgi:hypothetical protein
MVMPKPLPSAYPKHQRWRFVHHSFKDDEQLVSFSKAIAQSNNRDLDQSLPKILQFLDLQTSDIKVLKHAWLSLWINIMHQAGLGYTVTEGKKTKIIATDLGRFVADTGNVKAYYYYWALRFQFPFGYPKHSHYVNHKVAVQPVVLICQYLDQLNVLGDSLNDTFLGKYEIAEFLMKSTGHLQALIQDNCERIIKNRKKKYNYEAQRRNPEFEDTADHLFSRGHLFFDKFDLLVFRNDTVLVPDTDTLTKIRSFIAHRKPPILFRENLQDVRNQFFQQAYCNLDPAPEALLAIHTTTPSLESTSESLEAIMKAMMPEATINFSLEKIAKQVKRAKQKVTSPQQPRVIDIAKELSLIAVGTAPSQIKREGGVLVQPNIKMHAPTDLKLCVVDGEELYLPLGISVDEAKKHIEAVREFRKLVQRVLGLWPIDMTRLARFSIEPPYRDAHHEKECGIIFNVSAFEQKKPFSYWIWTAARELTYARFGRLTDMTLPFMRELVIFGFDKYHSSSPGG